MALDGIDEPVLVVDGVAIGLTTLLATELATLMAFPL